MNKIYVLTKMLFKTGAESNNQTFYRRPSLWVSLLIFLGMVGFVSIEVIPKIIAPFYDLFDSLNQRQQFLNLGLSIITVLIFRFGLSYSAKAFYSTKEIEKLLSMPIKFYQILSAKFLWIFLFQFGSSIIFLAPFLIVYGIKASVGIFYWIFAFLTVLILPVVPTAMASLINLTVLRFTNIGKHKDKLKAIGIVATFAIFIMANIFVPSNMVSQSDHSTLTNAIMFITQLVVGGVNLLVPTTRWATYSLAGLSTIEITINSALFVLVSIFAVLLFILLAQNLYLKSVVGSSEAFAEKTKLSDRKIEKSTKVNSKFKSYTLKELRLLIRNPAFLAISIGINFILPIFVLGTFAMNNNSAFSVEIILDFLTRKEILGTVVSVIYGVIFVVNGNNVLASTAVSREGRNMYINKYIPISYKEQIFSKILSVVIINLISSLLIVLVFIFAFKIPIGISAFMISITLIANIISSSLGLIFDINGPKLSWDDEYSILRINLNNLLSLGINLLIGGLSILLAIWYKPSLIIASASIAVFSLIIIALIFYYIVSKGIKVYSKIE